jgi:hypothetical protein
MAKPISIMPKPVGTFYALESQNTRQAPIPTAAEVAKPGVLPGYPYAVYFAVKINNVLWLLLESATLGKYEWAVADTDTGTGQISRGAYVGPIYGESL